MTRADPGSTSGDTAGYATTPPCRCGHGYNVHDVTKVLKACSAADRHRHCLCVRYQPREA